MVGNALVKSSTEYEESLENTMRFIVKSALYIAEGDGNNNENDDDTENRGVQFLHKLLQFLVECSSAALIHARLNSNTLLGRIITQLRDETLIDPLMLCAIRTALLEHVWDTNLRVRVQTVKSLACFQSSSSSTSGDGGGGQSQSSSVTTSYLYLLCKDPSPLVRTAVLNSIQMTRESTRFVLQRVNDVHSSVRKATYQVLQRQAGLFWRTYKGQALLHVLLIGLQDAVWPVRRAAQRLLANWFCAPSPISTSRSIPNDAQRQEQQQQRGSISGLITLVSRLDLFKFPKASELVCRHLLNLQPPTRLLELCREFVETHLEADSHVLHFHWPPAELADSSRQHPELLTERIFVWLTLIKYLRAKLMKRASSPNQMQQQQISANQRVFEQFGLQDAAANQQQQQQEELSRLYEEALEAMLPTNNLRLVRFVSRLYAMSCRVDFADFDSLKHVDYAGLYNHFGQDVTSSSSSSSSSLSSIPEDPSKVRKWSVAAARFRFAMEIAQLCLTGGSGVGFTDEYGRQHAIRLCCRMLAGDDASNTSLFGVSGGASLMTGARDEEDCDEWGGDVLCPLPLMSSVIELYMQLERHDQPRVCANITEMISNLLGDDDAANDDVIADAPAAANSKNNTNNNKDDDNEAAQQQQQQGNSDLDSILMPPPPPPQQQAHAQQLLPLRQRNARERTLRCQIAEIRMEIVEKKALSEGLMRRNEFAESQLVMAELAALNQRVMQLEQDLQALSAPPPAAASVVQQAVASSARSNEDQDEEEEVFEGNSRLELDSSTTVALSGTSAAAAKPVNAKQQQQQQQKERPNAVASGEVASDLELRAVAMAHLMLHHCDAVWSLIPCQRTLLNILLLPNVQSKHRPLRTLTISALATCCLHDFEVARKWLALLFLVVRVDNFMPAKRAAMCGLFDLFMRFRLKRFQEATQAEQDAEAAGEVAGEEDSEFQIHHADDATHEATHDATSSKYNPQHDTVVKQTSMLAPIVNLMNSAEASLVQTAILGLTRLLYYEIIESPKLLARLLLYWYNGDKSDPLVQEYLSRFFSDYAMLNTVSYPSSSSATFSSFSRGTARGGGGGVLPKIRDNRSQLMETFFIAIKIVLDAPASSCLARIDAHNVGSMLIWLIDNRSALAARAAHTHAHTEFGRPISGADLIKKRSKEANKKMGGDGAGSESEEEINDEKQENDQDNNNNNQRERGDEQDEEALRSRSKLRNHQQHQIVELPGSHFHKELARRLLRLALDQPDLTRNVRLYFRLLLELRLVASFDAEPDLPNDATGGPEAATAEALLDIVLNAKRLDSLLKHRTLSMQMAKWLNKVIAQLVHLSWCVSSKHSSFSYSKLVELGIVFGPPNSPHLPSPMVAQLEESQRQIEQNDAAEQHCNAMNDATKQGEAEQQNDAAKGDGQHEADRVKEKDGDEEELEQENASVNSMSFISLMNDQETKFCEMDLLNTIQDLKDQNSRQQQQHRMRRLHHHVAAGGEARSDHSDQEGEEEEEEKEMEQQEEEKEREEEEEGDLDNAASSPPRVEQSRRLSPRRHTASDDATPNTAAAFSNSNTSRDSVGCGGAGSCKPPPKKVQKKLSSSPTSKAAERAKSSATSSSKSPSPPLVSARITRSSLTSKRKLRSNKK